VQSISAEAGNIKFSDIMNTNFAKEFALEIVLEKDE